MGIQATLRNKDADSTHKDGEVLGENRCHFVKCWWLAKVEDGPGFQWRPILTQILVDSHICHSNSCCIIVFDHNPTVSLFHITAYVFCTRLLKKDGTRKIETTMTHCCFSTEVCKSKGNSQYCPELRDFSHLFTLENYDCKLYMHLHQNV